MKWLDKCEKSRSFGFFIFVCHWATSQDPQVRSAWLTLHVYNVFQDRVSRSVSELYKRCARVSNTCRPAGKRRGTPTTQPPHARTYTKRKFERHIYSLGTYIYMWVYECIICKYACCVHGDHNVTCAMTGTSAPPTAVVVYCVRVHVCTVTRRFWWNFWPCSRPISRKTWVSNPAVGSSL